MSYPISDEMMAKEKAEEERNNAVLAEVHGYVSEADFQAIKEELSEGGYIHSFAIVDAPRGSEQDEEYEHGMRHVDQTVNGGFSGDDYAGEVYIPISPDKWFKFSYCM